MTTEPDPVKAISKRVGFNLIAHAITWIILTSLPFVLGALAGVVAYFEPLPWTHILVAASFVFAATATGILRVAEFRYRATAQNKLIFIGIAPGVNFIKDTKTGKAKAFDRVQLGIILQNVAHLPISYKVEEIETSFEGMVNQKPDRKFRGTLIDPNVHTIFKDASIETRKLPIDKTLFDGHIKFKLKYGFPELEKYHIEKNLNVNLSYDRNTGNFLVAGMSDRVD